MSDHDHNTEPTPPHADDDDAQCYPCVGICMADPESGRCQGCGRPLAEPEAPESHA